LAKLAGGVAVLIMGAAGRNEGEKKIELMMLHATRAAAEEIVE
jgi:hypothetical protein